MLKYSKTGQDLRKVQVFEVPIFYRCIPQK